MFKNYYVILTRRFSRRRRLTMFDFDTRDFEFEKEKSILDEQGLRIAENQENSQKNRRKLAQNTRGVCLVLLLLFSKGLPLLDPEEDMKIQSSSYKKASRRIEALGSLFEKHEIAKSPLIKQKLKVLQRKQALTVKMKSMKKTLRSSSALAFKDELKARKRVLRRLG